MTVPKRKTKAKSFVKDLREGMGDRQLMEKYVLSSNQLRRVFRRLIDGGALDEMELYMRTSLSDSSISKAFLDIGVAN